MGMVTWYSKFIPSFSSVSEPLNKLKTKDVVFSWSEACQASFISLKDSLCEAECLAYLAPEGNLEIHTDASNYGLGAVLHQWQMGELKTLEYAHKTLNSYERNYSTCECECLAVVWALERWRPIIDSKVLTVVTDHQALCWLFSSKKLNNSRLIR